MKTISSAIASHGVPYLRMRSVGPRRKGKGRKEGKEGGANRSSGFLILRSVLYMELKFSSAPIFISIAILYNRLHHSFNILLSIEMV